MRPSAVAAIIVLLGLPVFAASSDIDLFLPIVGRGHQLGGRVFDSVILHTFFTDDTLARCVATIRAGAEKAGRDPDSVRIWSCLATAA